MKRWFRSCDLHARSFTNSFVCNFLSSSAGINLCRCFSRLTLALRFRFRFSLGFHFHGLLPLPLLFLTSAVFAFFRPLQFWILTTQPLFLPFPLLPDSASQWLPQCSALTFVPAVFPVLSCLVSRAFLPGSGTQPRCMFPFALPRFAPTAVPQVLTFRSLFRYFPFRFRILSSASASLPATQPSASSFLPSGPSASQSALCPGSVPCVPFASPLHPRPVSRPLLSGSAYSAFCLFPFVLPCFAPTAVPQVLPFWISPQGSTPSFRSLSISSALASHYSAFCSSFPDSPCSPHSWLPGSSVSPLGSPAFIRSPRLVSHTLRSALQYSAFCLFPFVLPCFAPTAVPQVLTFFPSFDFPEVFSLRSPFFRPVPV